MAKSSPVLLAIVPVFNEGEGLRAFNDSLWTQEEAISQYGWDLEVLYVDDGSVDSTPVVLADLSHRNPRIRFLRLTRNFGTQAALCAGLESADADAAVMLDGDGQHPVELIPEMLRLHLAGSDIIRTARLDNKHGGAPLKRWASRRFHSLWAHLCEVSVPAGTTDFALLGQSAIKALQQFHETHRYLRGLLTLVGFTTTTLEIPILPRQHGATKCSLGKQFRLASDAVFSFSILPLRLALLPAFLFVFVACLEMAATAWRFLSGAPITPGWTSLMIIVTLGFGCTMALLAIIGIYIGKIFEQVKNRPVYLVRPDIRPKSRSAEQTPISFEQDLERREDRERRICQLS